MIDLELKQLTGNCSTYIRLGHIVFTTGQARLSAQCFDLKLGKPVEDDVLNSFLV